jgi:hypothetical protein
MHKKSDSDNNKTRSISKASEGGCGCSAHWALFQETKAICTDETALRWATKTMNAFSRISAMPTVCQRAPKLALGGDRAAEEGKPLMRIGGALAGEDTFTITGYPVEEVTKIKALRTPQTMKAHLRNEERIKRVVDKHEEEEKVKADKKPTGNEELKRKAIELLKGSDDEDTNTNNGGGSGEEDWGLFGEALQRHSGSKKTASLGSPSSKPLRQQPHPAAAAHLKTVVLTGTF